MRNLTWRMGWVALALVAFISYPAVSFAVPDCSYSGVFNPPLKDVNPVDGFCEISGSPKARGSVILTPANPMEITSRLSLGVSEQPPLFPLAFLPGSFVIEGSVLATLSPSNAGDLNITARGDIRNDLGIMSMIAPFDQVRLKASSNIFLQGPDLAGPGQTLSNPSTNLVGQTVKLISEKGDIRIDNAAIVSYSFSLDIFAPRGNIFVHNSIFFVLQDRANTVGFCRYQPKVENHVQVGVVDISDPNNIFVCVPQIIKD